MTTKPKTLDINHIRYAQASEFEYSWHTLERLVAENDVKKVTFAGVNYYDVEAVKRLTAQKRTVPEGYVRVMAYAKDNGLNVHKVRDACSGRGAPATQLVHGSNRPAWYAEKTWLDKKFMTAPPITVAKAPKAQKPAKTPKRAKATTEDNAAALSALLERAEALVTRLEGILGTERGPRDTNTLNIAITPANANGTNGAH